MTVRELGPLAPLVGVWEGDKGHDISPSEDRGTGDNKFRERIVFEEIGDVDNHEQLLYGLRYQTTVWPIGKEDPFHEEVGYWLWDAKEKQAMKCFIVPRGVNVIAGGTVEPDSRSFDLAAEAGSDTYGICSNKFLIKEFKTTKYELNITIHDENSFSYKENTIIKMKGRDELFNHTDENTLRRVGTAK